MAREWPDPRITFVTAWSGVGKTTTGDYLGCYCGLRHLDGGDSHWPTGRSFH
jgi:2-phosphoglycerate kinase